MKQRQMNRRTLNRLGLCMTAMALVGGMSACSNPRRVPLGETTRPELEDPRQLPVSYDEFEQGAVADLLQRMPDLPKVSRVDGQATILLGDIINTTGVVNTSEYEMVMEGIRSKLIGAQATRNKLKFVERRARVEHLAGKERIASKPAPPPAGSEEIRWGGGQYYVPDYDADKTFGLFMTARRVGRGSTNLYSIELQVVSFADNSIVYSYRRQTKQASE